MKTLFINFLSILRRFKIASGLNVFGLSIAFSAFMVIMMQLDYDWNFDKIHTDASNIFRVEKIHEGTPYAVLSRPLSDRIIASSPHIIAGTVAAPSTKYEMFFSVENNGVRSKYREKALKVYPNYGDVFEFNMFDGDKEALSNPNTVLIPLTLSRKLFGSESAIGHLIDSEEQTYTIGGVYKDFPSNTIVENNIYYSMQPNENIQDWDRSMFYLFLKLDDPANSQLVIDNFIKNFDVASLGEGYSWLGGLKLQMTALPDIHYTTDVLFDFTPKTTRTTVLALLAIAIIILLIAGINFTNFSTALPPMRIKSINTQKVLGANDSKLRQAMMMEAVCVSLLSFILSIGIVHLFSVSPLSQLVNADLSLIKHWGILSSTAAISLVTGILAGVYPAYYTTSFSPALVLKGSFGLTPKGRKLRNSLISLQFFASFALIICSLFMYLQTSFMQNSPLGYDKDLLVVSDIPADVIDKKETLSDQLKRFPEISNVTFSEALISGSDQFTELTGYYKGESFQYQCIPVDYSFFQVLGIQTQEGRSFRKEDALNPNGVYIFNEKAMLANDLEIGAKLNGIEIVGIIPDIKFASFRTEVEPMAFQVGGYNMFRNLSNNYIYVKINAGSDIKATMANIQGTLDSFNSTYLFNIRFFDEVIQKLYESESRFSTLIILFSLITALISIVGVFGLVVFDSEYRRKEIGVRKVLGSTIREILLLFNKTYFRILTVCFVFSVPVAWYTVDRWLENFAYKTPMYWWVFFLAFLLVSLTTSCTVTFQSWRVAVANPVDSIKTE